MENFYFYSSKEIKSKEVKQTSETSAKQGYLIRFPSSLLVAGELPAAVHDGNGVSRAFLNLWLIHLTMSYVFSR